MLTLRPTPDGTDMMCEFGVIERSDPRPERGDVQHLMLTTRDYVDHLLAHGPTVGGHGQVDSVRLVDGVLYADIEYNGQRWTWQLYEADWWDGKGPEILVGRWPD